MATKTTKSRSEVSSASVKKETKKRSRKGTEQSTAKAKSATGTKGTRGTKRVTVEKSVGVVKKVSKVKEKRATASEDSGVLTMEELLAMTGTELRVPKRGDVIEGVITEINKRMVLVDIGAKTEGMVVEKEYDETKELIGDLNVGDAVAVYVSSPENDRGQILLSLKRAAVDRKWEQFGEFLETGKVVKVKGLEVNRGGLIVLADGLRGFVPSSQFGKVYLGRMDVLLDERFEVKVIEVDKPKNRLIFSEREVSEAQAIENKNKALDVIEIGGNYNGVVSGIMPFGVFVTVTVPLRKQKPSKSSASGQVKIKDQKDESKKKGEDKGVGQVEGLVHISEISWEKVNDPNDYFTQGDRVEVRVLGIDNGKLNLSVKQLSGDPWKNILKKYEVGTTVRGKVTRVEPFGVFVTLEPGVDGLIHISKIEAGKEPEAGREVDVVVDSVDVDNRRMSLGMVLTEVPVIYK